ncbi:ATP-binding protein [Microbacterium sp. CH-015]|uniref:ATP/GTP-binding protein n=1 Tax=Microbacterium sp. CH-015 TaxID=3406734 RepID=UPI003C706A2A
MKIAISGTYGTGKTTLARVLSERMGVPLVGARGMRDFLHEHMDGKALTDCTPYELMELGMRRFEERVATEAASGEHFVSDGSTLNEWAYGLARRTLGIHPGDDRIRDASTADREAFDGVMAWMGRVFRDHAARSYDLIVHLPVEFPMAADGHRPVSDEYRKFSGDLLSSAPAELGLRMIQVSGPVDARAHAVLAANHGRPVEP